MMNNRLYSRQYVNLHLFGKGKISRQFALSSRQGKTVYNVQRLKIE